jgi:hypothetical protein
MTAANNRQFTADTVPADVHVRDLAQNRPTDSAGDRRHVRFVGGYLLKGATMTRFACCAGAACVALSALAAPTANARGEGDTHIYGTGQEMTIDCNNGTLFITGSFNVVNASGVCYAVTMQGTGNVVIADTVTDDITVYGSDQTVMYHNGDPYVLDRGRELGMTNRIDRV